MKVYVHPHVTGDLLEELNDLLREIGCEIVDNVEDCVIVLEAGDGPREDGQPCDEDALRTTPACVVVLTPGLTEEDLQPTLTQVVARGCRVIGIWGPGADGDMSPLGDYGADTVPWQSERVRDAICGKPQHQDPGGAAAKKPEPTTGGC